MSLLAKLLAKRSVKSSLQIFGENLTPRAIAAAMRTNQRKDDRIACGVAVATLMTADRFASGFQKFLSEMPHLGRKGNDRLPYDALMVEAAAYCHYLLSRDYRPTQSDDDLDEADNLDDQPHSTEEVDGSEVCAKALFFSQALLAKCMPTSNAANFLERRMLFYLGKALPRDERVVAEFFSSVVLSIIDEELPNASTPRGIRPGLQFTLAAGAYIPIFHQTHVAALRQAIQNLFENSDALLRELSQ